MRHFAWIAVMALCASMLVAPAAHADLASLKNACVTRDAADNDTSNGLQLPYRFCDDGVPDQGGRTPNPNGAKAVKVPAKYAGEQGLPKKASDAATMPGAAADGTVALDVDVSLPPESMPAPTNGFPVIVFMHGCCTGSKASWEATTTDPSGEKWHDTTAWFASRGYVVITYTSRGFVNQENKGSTGETQLQSRQFEINDYQYLAGVIADDNFRPRFFKANGSKVVTIGGSYGGGFSWLTLTDPRWASPGGKPMKLAATAPKYGWTDLVNSLMPNGRQSSDPAKLSSTTVSGADSRNPTGILKQSIVAGLFGTGSNATGNHTTFPQYLTDAFACLNSGETFYDGPTCASTFGPGGTLESLLADRSAYYQQRFFDQIASEPSYRVPVFSAGTFYDPLFPTVEHARMANRLRSVVPNYPVKEYYGDYEHLYSRNLDKEWDDVCGDRVCNRADYVNGANADPAGLTRRGVNTMISRFIDHYAAPPANASEPAPSFETTAALRTCPPSSDAGERFSGASLQALAPGRLEPALGAVRTQTSNPNPNPHAADADPVAAEGRGVDCIVSSGDAGPGVAVFESEPFASLQTVLGVGRVTIDYATLATDLELNTRLYDVAADGTAALIDRGVYRVKKAPAPGGDVASYELLGAAWTIPAGHRLRVEVAQDDSPFARADNFASSATINSVRLSLPVR